MEPWELTAVDLSTALQRRELSAVEALHSVLSRAEEVGESINPFSVDLHGRALHAAYAADARLARGAAGPLAGLPISAKDSQWPVSYTHLTLPTNREV